MGLADKALSSIAFLEPGEQLLISINRFERKKNIALALEAFAALPEQIRNRSKLILAGGYDKGLPENVQVAQELADAACKLGVDSRVKQMWSISAEQKATLLRHASCLLYTPDMEHFGIVPVEGMYAKVPVVAVNTGGPTESIVDGKTGFLRAQDSKEWAKAVAQILESTDLQKSMGEKGRQRVIDVFSLKAFGDSLIQSMDGLAKTGH